MMPRTNGPLRDFIYLDWERVRSLAAQLLEGLPEGSRSDSEHQAGADVGVDAGLAAILKAQGEAKYLYTRNQGETRTFHHFVYSLFEAELEKQERVLDIGAGYYFKRWKKGFLRDGQIVRVRGSVQIMDFDWTADMVEELPEYLKSLGAMKAVAEDKVEAGLQQLEALKANEIVGMIRRVYGGTTLVKVIPSRDNADKLFVGEISKENLHDTIVGLGRKYGHQIDAGWVAVGQVNMPRGSGGQINAPTGNALVERFEQLALVMNETMRVAGTVQFPAISFTPISIYRTI